MSATIVPFKAPPEFGAVGGSWWNDKPAFLVGGGPSLTGFDLGRLGGLGYLCGVNQSMFSISASAGISIDHRFVRERRSELVVFAQNTELYLSLGNHWWHTLEPVAGAVNLRDEWEPGLSIAPVIIRRGGTSGYAALNLAVLKRAKRIVLLGYDYGLIDGRHHYHDAYPWHVPKDQNWASWAKRYDAAATQCRDLGVEVINASVNSAIECFSKMSIEDALQWARRC